MAWARRNSDLVGPERLGAGPVPCRRNMAHRLEGASRTPMVASSPWTRRNPQVGFSWARRRTIETVPAGKLGRPERRCEYVHPVSPDLGANGAGSRAGRKSAPGERPRATGPARRALLGPLVAERGGRPGGATPKPRGGASRPRWQAPLGRPGRAGPVGADERKQCKRRRTTCSIFVISITPRKSTSKGLDDVFGTHRGNNEQRRTFPFPRARAALPKVRPAGGWRPPFVPPSRPGPLRTRQ